jgi:CubicO group peptidase (beta-lactamase class C family)
MPEGVGPADICDWERMCRGIADLTPLYEPGTRTIYHALTFGWLLGEVARRVDGRPFGQMIQDEICAPLGLTSLYLGIPDEVASRVATLESAPISQAEQAAFEALLAATSSDPLSPLSLAMLSIPPALQPLSDLFNRPDVRRACIPAAGGIMNARSLARFYAALAVGEANSASLLSMDAALAPPSG